MLVKNTTMAHVKVSFFLSLKLKSFIHIVLLINGSVSYIYIYMSLQINCYFQNTFLLVLVLLQLFWKSCDVNQIKLFANHLFLILQKQFLHSVELNI